MARKRGQRGWRPRRRSPRGKRVSRFHAFLSHSSEDEAIVKKILDVLESHGIRCWYAPRDIAPGACWPEKIINAIAASRIMILVFSSHANRSPDVKREIRHGASRGVAILPIRIDGTPISKELEYFISSYQWLNASAKPVKQHLNTILEAARELIQGKNVTQ